MRATGIPHYTKAAPCDRTGLVHHIAFATRALADRGSMEIRTHPREEPLILRRRNRKTLPDVLEIRITAGRVGRKEIYGIAEHLEEFGIPFRTSVTKVNRLLREIRIPFEIRDCHVASQIAELFYRIFRLWRPEPFDFHITYCGPFEFDYFLREEDPVQPHPAYRLGWRTVTFLRSLFG